MIFYAKINPNAKSNKIVDFSKDIFGNYVVKIRLQAIPEKGKANEELIIFLSQIFKTTKKEIQILKGKTSSLKQIEIPSSIDSQTFENTLVKQIINI